MNLVFILSLLISIPSHAQSFATNAVQNSNTRQIVGSSMQIRTATNSRNPYQFITAAHVLENNSNIMIAGLSVKPVLLDSAMDFVVLEPVLGRTNFELIANVPYDLGTSYFGPSRYFEIFRKKALIVPSTFHLSVKSRETNSILLRVDGFDPRSNKLDRRFFRSPAILTNVGGIPGRDQQGSLLQFEADLVPGASGSPVTAFVDEEGEIYDGETDPCLPRDLFCRWRPRVLGIVTSIVTSTHGISVLPIWTIVNRIESPITLVSPLLTKHFRNPGRGKNAGVQRGSDGGAPRGSDGSISLNGELQWSSGLRILDDPNKKWLDISDFWTENEPFNETLWSRSGSSRIGIYEQNFVLKRSGPEAKWPIWIDPKLTHILNPANSSQCSVMNTQRWSLRPDGSPFQILGQQVVRLCVESNSNEHKLVIEEIGKNKRRLLMNLHFSDSGSYIVESIKDYKGTNLTREGLRTYENENVRLEIDFSTGLSILFKQESQYLIGPVW